MHGSKREGKIQNSPLPLKNGPKLKTGIERKTGKLIQEKGSSLGVKSPMGRQRVGLVYTVQYTAKGESGNT